MNKKLFLIIVNFFVCVSINAHPYWRTFSSSSSSSSSEEYEGKFNEFVRRGIEQKGRSSIPCDEINKFSTDELESMKDTASLLAWLTVDDIRFGRNIRKRYEKGSEQRETCKNNEKRKELETLTLLSLYQNIVQCQKIGKFKL